MNNLFIVSSSPHIRGTSSVQKIMLDVVIALIPALGAGVYFFGIRALYVTLFSVICCVVFEGLWQRLTKRAVTIFDLSAVITGILLAMNLPVGIPYWMVIPGAFFAIIIVKQLFGGLGHNFMNPALAARAFLLASWPAEMTNWVTPADAVSTATVLTGYMRPIPTYFEMFIGKMPGCIGEVSAAALLLGGLYLIAKRVINPILPLSFLGTVFIFTTMAGPRGFMTGDGLMHLLSGGLLLDALFHGQPVGSRIRLTDLRILCGDNLVKRILHSELLQHRKNVRAQRARADRNRDRPGKMLNQRHRPRKSLRSAGLEQFLKDSGLLHQQGP